MINFGKPSFEQEIVRIKVTSRSDRGGSMSHIGKRVLFLVVSRRRSIKFFYFFYLMVFIGWI